MPARIRHSPLGAGLSLAELPILPFLAPRLLQTWPRNRRGQRAQSTASIQLESSTTQSLDINRQTPSISSASQQTPPSEDLTRHVQLQYGLPYGRNDGRRGTQIRNGVNDSHGGSRRPTPASVEATTFYSPQGRTSADDIATPKFDQSVRTHLQEAAAQKNPIDQNKGLLVVRDDESEYSFNLTGVQRDGDTKHRFWEAPHLDMLHDFIKADRKLKGQDKGRYFGWWWERWFDRRQNTSQLPYRGYSSKHSWRKVMQRIESIANFDTRTDISTLRFEWTEIPLKARQKYWPGLMLGILSKRPDDALKFLVATCAHPLPHRNYIEDCLDYIVEHYLYRQTHSKIASEDFAILFGVINDLLTQFKQNELRVSEYAIYHICRHANRLQTEALYNTLRLRHQKLSLHCSLHFVDYLARRGSTDTAVTILRSMHRQGVDFTEPRIESVCATLLRCSQQDPEAVESESQIFSLLLEWGIRPKINFYNILAHNAFESGDHETAWKVYYMLIENGIEPSHHTYSIFLNDAKLRLDRAAMQHILDGVRANNIRNEYVTTDLLHAMLVMHEKDSKDLSGEENKVSSKSLFQRMLLLYSTYFETAPLEDFAPEYFTADGKPSPEVEGGRMHPDYPTLTLMITAAIRCRIEQSELPRLYNRFKRLVEDGHPDFVKVARQTNVFDALIKVMGQHPRTLPFSTQILGDMLGTEDPPGSQQFQAQLTDIRSTSHLENRVKRMASPTIHTWSILVHAFMTQGQPRAAEKIVEMMKGRGMEPNQVTWSTLIVGYSQMQDMANITHSLNRAKLGGWTIDESILNRLDPISSHIALDQKPQTIPWPPKISEPHSESRENMNGANTSSPPSSPDRSIQSRHSSDFQINPTKIFLLTVEAERVNIGVNVQRLLKRAARNPNFASQRLEEARMASKRLEELQDQVDARLEKL